MSGTLERTHYNRSHFHSKASIDSHSLQRDKSSTAPVPPVSISTSFTHTHTLAINVTMMMNKRPNNPITMAGMIWNANHVLASALDPKTPGVPRALFEHDLKGIILISTVEVGLVFTGNVGSGILLARRNGGWSPPCAVGLGG
jgi:hypothetical protein